MRFFSRVILFALKTILPFYYIGAKRANGMASLSFKHGAVFETRLNSQDAFVLNEIWKYHCYDEAEIAPEDVVVDIGAHIGGYTVLASKKGATVYAYEPEPGNYRLLKRNTAINRCKKAKLYNLAVSSRKGAITLNVDAKGSGLHSLYQLSSASRRATVLAVPLHEVITANKLKSIQVLKIDAEGAEYGILLPASRSDLKKIRTIILEYHDYIDHGHNKKQLELILRDSGFKVHDIAPWYQHFFMKSGTLIAKRSSG